jgi:hypothetical protein
MSIASRVQAVISPELTALIESETVDASKPIIAIFTVIDGLPDIEATVDFVIKAAEQLTQRKAIKVNLSRSSSPAGLVFTPVNSPFT